MTISQSEKELDAAFENALQLKEKIEKNYILKPGNNKNLPEDIMQFIKSNREIILKGIENKNTTSDILLARVMKEFYDIHKILVPSKHTKQTGSFFPYKQNNEIMPIERIEQVKIHLKTINEIFNMLPEKTPHQAMEQYNRPTLGA
ncbi:MAG: hypothetical protein RJA83_211 [Pseudomonadota bacterium]|jgi:hypothetical protein